MNILSEYPDIKSNILFKFAHEEKISKYITPDKYYVQSFSAGEDIITHVSQDVPVGFILSGRVTVTSADGTKSVILKTVGVGSVFGISTLYAAETPFPTDIKAKSACEVLFIKSDAIRDLIENDRATSIAFMGFLSDRIVYLNKKINAFTAGSAERRLSLFLADNECEGIYSPNVSISSLAEMLDIGRASLYRAFDKLEAEGFIEKHEKTIIIKNKAAMLEKYFS